MIYLGSELEGREREDYVGIPRSESGIGPEHMLLEYREEVQGFYARDNQSDLGTFVKVQTPLQLVAGYTFAFGDSSIMVAFANPSRLVVKLASEGKDEQS
eukprot:TRINITY_DN4790_c0_g1_i3.p2 TRINITY_DN4790_c0_g1~~TRINITY_DN4790_c0_g1_i3.p2  ORF type:complete len:100 (-),score=33.83 TRINITY_DN4790_c0_g1_i3:435-734(-)